MLRTLALKQKALRQRNLQKACLSSRLRGDGGLDEWGCKCNSCKLDEYNYKQWNKYAHKRYLRWQKERRESALLGASNLAWSKDYAVPSNNMPDDFVEWLKNIQIAKEMKVDRNTFYKFKVLYHARDILEENGRHSYVPIYKEQ